MKNPIRSLAAFTTRHRILSFSLAVLFILLVAWRAWIWANVTELRRLENEIKKRGEPLTHEELNNFYEQVPDAENAALIYEEAFKKCHKATDDESKRLIFFGVEKFPYGEKIAPELVAMGNIFIEKNKEALELLKKATALEKCRFAVDYKNGYGTNLPHLGQMRQAAKLLVLEALLKTEEGDIDSAIDSLSAASKLGNHLYREPTLLAFNYGNATELTMLMGLGHCLNMAGFSNDQIEKFRQILDGLPELKTRAKRALLGERAMFSGTTDKSLLEQYNICWDIYGTIFCDKHLPGWMDKFFSFAFIHSGFAYSNRINYMACMSEQIEFSQIEYDKKIMGDYIHEIESRIKGPNGFLCRIFLPLSNISQKIAIWKCRRDLFHLALDAREFELKNGRLPDSLDELVPKFISEIPEDPFGTGKFRLFKGEIELGEKKISTGEDEGKKNGLMIKKERFVVVKKDGVLIYSVGPDGVDNFGAAFDKRYGNGRNSDISVVVLPANIQ